MLRYWPASPESRCGIIHCPHKISRLQDIRKGRNCWYDRPRCIPGEYRRCDGYSWSKIMMLLNGEAPGMSVVDQQHHWYSGFIRLNFTRTAVWTFYIHSLPVALYIPFETTSFTCTNSMKNDYYYRLSLLNWKRRQQASNKLPRIPTRLRIFGKKSLVVGHCKKKRISININDPNW